MAIQNYGFNNLDAKLSNDAYWDFFLSSDQRDFTQEVIYSTEIISYSAQTSLFSNSFYSTRLPIYMDLNDPECSPQLEIGTLSTHDQGGILTITLGGADGNRTAGLYHITSTCSDTLGIQPTAMFSPAVGVVGCGASFYLVVDGSGAATLSGSSAYFNSIAGGYGYKVGDILTIPDSNLGGGGAVDLSITVNSVTTSTVINGGRYFSGNTLLSKMAWNGASVTDSQEIVDIGLTGIDNALMPTFTGQTLNLATSIPKTPEDYTFDPSWYDYRMKMKQISGYTSFWDKRTNGEILTFSVTFGSTNVNRPAGTYTVNYGNYTTNSTNGINASFSIVVDGNGVTSVADITIQNPGNYYVINDKISIPDTMLGDAATGGNLTIAINTVSTGVIAGTVTYPMRSDFDRSGFFYQLYGGWFQGFYNFFSYGYQVIPKRVDKGWTVECLLKVRSSGSSWNNEKVVNLNSVYPDNEGIFFYYGARSENKFWNCYGGETGYTISNNVTGLYNCTGSCKYTGVSADTCQSAQNFSCADGTCTDEVSCIDPNQCNSTWAYNGTNTGWTYDDQMFSGDFYTSAQTEYQIMSNNFALRLSGGPEYGGYKLGYRALRFTGDTAITGTSNSFACSGGTYATGYTIEEQYSSLPICTGNTADSWIKVDAVFKRNNFYGTALEKLWRGGTNLITTLTCEEETFEMSGSSATTTNVIEGEKLFIQNIAWTGDRSNRVGTLTLYANSRPVLIVEDFEEIIPRRLNELPPKQLGEPFNMSFGGGSQGLHESLTLSGTPGEAAVLWGQSFSQTKLLNGLRDWQPMIKGNLWSVEPENSPDILWTAGVYAPLVVTSDAPGVGYGASISITINAVGDLIASPIAGSLGVGFQDGDTITIPVANIGGTGPDAVITVTQTDNGTIVFNSGLGDDDNVILDTTTSIYGPQTSKLYYKEYTAPAVNDAGNLESSGYQRPVVEGETYDIFLRGYGVSGTTSIDMGFSATTASTSPFNQPYPTGPQVTYVFKDFSLPTEITGNTSFYKSYKATLTGNLFVGITPGSIGKVVLESVVVSKQAYRRDLADESMLIEKHFGGSYMGGISQMRFYIEPLDASELIHNYYTNKERYGLIDCDCGNLDTPVEGCDTEYAIFTFPVGIDEVSLDFGTYRMIRWDYTETENVLSWSGETNYHDVPIRYSSVEPYCTDLTQYQPFLTGRPILHKCLTQADCEGTGFGQCNSTWNTNVLPINKFPFTVVPNKPFTIKVTRILPASEAKITFTGKRVR